MSDYRERLYTSYHSTHVVHRKGADDRAALEVRGAEWDVSLLPHFPADHEAQILDAACGNGALVWWLRERGYRNTTGVDLSPEQVDAGRGVGIEGISVGDTLTTLSASPASKDVIVMRDVLEHFRKDEVFTVLDAALAALVPTGRLLLHVPNAESPFFGRIRYGDFTHETAFTASSIYQVLSAVGFSAVRVTSSRPVGTTLKSRLRVRVWSVLERVYRAGIFIETGRRAPVVTQNLIAVAFKP